MSDGFVSLPKLLVEYSGRLGIKPAELGLIVALDSFRHGDSPAAWPNLKTLAECLGVSVDTVRRLTRSLEDQGLIEVDDHYSAASHDEGRETSNRYGLAGLRDLLEKIVVNKSQGRDPLEGIATLQSGLRSAAFERRLARESRLRGALGPRAKTLKS